MLFDLAVTFAASFALLTLAAVAPKLIAPQTPTHARQATDAERAYVCAVRDYLAQCRDLAELLADVPSPREYKQRFDAAHVLYSRVPEAPASIDPNKVLGCALAELRMKFAAADTFVAKRDSAGCYRLACEQQRRTARVEQMLAHWLRGKR